MSPLTERRVKRAVQKLGGATVNRLGIVAARRGLPVAFFGADSALAIATVGRKSGKHRITPMGYVRVSSDTLLVVAEHGGKSDWVRNALAAGTVDVWLGGRSYAARVQLRPGLAPDLVRLQMKGRLLAAANRALSFESAVIEIRLL